MPFVVSPMPGVDFEEIVLDGLDLHDRVVFYLRDGEPVDMSPPRQRAEWIGAADSEYQDLVRNPLHENRVVVLPLQLGATADKDAALTQIGMLVDKLALASKTRGGIPLTWRAAGSAVTVTFDVLAGEITELPLDRVFSVNNRPRLTVTLTCKPYWHGEETLTTTTTGSGPALTKEIENLIGDVPALGRLIITDTATQSRRFVQWGLEGPQTYDPATGLILDSDSLVTSGFSGTGTTRTGAYDPNATGNQVITASLTTTPTAICSTGSQAHVGVFRVIARVQAFILTQFRISYQVAGGQWISNPWVTSHKQAGWLEMDLGTVTIPNVLAGTQSWIGRIDGRTTSGADSPVLDYLMLIPATDGWGKARAVFSSQPGVRVAYDDFTGTTAGANLNARVSPLGGTWATSGVATDFQFGDAIFVSSEHITRATASDATPRFAVLGATNYTDVEVSSRVLTNGYSGVLGVIARWTDSSNYLRVTWSRSPHLLTLTQRVAGVDTILAEVPSGTFLSSQWYTLRLVVFATGDAYVQLLNPGGAVAAQTEASSTALATAGTLATGKPGLYDINTVASVQSRVYDDFQVSFPAPQPIVVYSGRNMQVRHDETIRQDSTGVYTGKVRPYRGSRFLVPVGTSRVLAYARRTDAEASGDETVADSLQLQVGVTPRGLVVPRQ